VTIASAGSFFVPMLVFAGINLAGMLVAVALLFFNSAWDDDILNLTARQIDLRTSALRVDESSIVLIPADDACALYKPIKSHHHDDHDHDHDHESGGGGHDRTSDGLRPAAPTETTPLYHG
jgi:hypothetical protein